MKALAREKRSTLAFAGLVLGVCLLPGCRDLGGDKIILTDACGATQSGLQATWKISVARKNLTCPAGVTFKTTGTTNTFTNVTVSATGSGFDVNGVGLHASVLLDKCRVNYSFVDRDTNGLFECFGTFVPASGPIGAGLTDAHCTGVLLDIDKNGTRETSCAIPAPYLDSIVTLSAP